MILYLDCGYNSWSCRSFSRADDTAELLKEAARAAPCSSKLDSAETTQALLKTFVWSEPAEEDTCCTVITVAPQSSQDQQLNEGVLKTNPPGIKIIPGTLISAYLQCL